MKSICSCACYRGRAVLVYNDAVQRCDCAGAEVRSCRCSGAIVQVQWCDCAGAVVRLCRCSGAIVQVQWCDCVCASICAGAVVRLCMCKYLCKLYIVYNLVCVYTCNLYPTCILLVSYLYIVFFNYWPWYPLRWQMAPMILKSEALEVHKYDMYLMYSAAWRS